MDYKTLVFIDTNVVLECLDLRQLPWFEIDKSGPVLVMLTPTVLREVDSKKNDGRLGNHARRFNNLLRPLLGLEEVTTVRSSPFPRVDVALARCSAISWHDFPELDQSEADARIIAEILHTEAAEPVRKVFVSQDIRPLDLARRYGVEIYHIGENWLRPKEITTAERKVAALEKQIAALKISQPELLLEWSYADSSVDVLRVNSLSDSEQDAILDRIRKQSPRPRQEQQNGYSTRIIGDFNYDYTLDDRYDEWLDHQLPRFVNQLDKKMELLYNQVEISIILRNVGQVQAESLLIELTATGGWMNSKLILVAPTGPSAPRPRPLNMFGPDFHSNIPRVNSPPGKHEVVVEDEVKRSCYVRIGCEDFRHGSEYEYKFVAWLDPWIETPFRVDAVLTAANLRGESSSSLILQKCANLVTLDDLIDLDELKYRKQSLAQERLLQNIGPDLSGFEFDSDDY